MHLVEFHGGRSVEGGGRHDAVALVQRGHHVGRVLVQVVDRVRPRRVRRAEVVVGLVSMTVRIHGLPVVRQGRQEVVLVRL